MINPQPGDGVMNTIVALLILNSITSPLAVAADSQETLRNALDICRQFVIQDPDPGIRFLDQPRCCVPGNRVHNCNVDFYEDH
jgi:hypothetical protein